jgi:methylmalonyl-CoA mutase
MAKAIGTGMPKRRIEESAARKQAGIDKGDIVIVGVNKYTLKNEDPVEIRDIDNSAVRESQIARLNAIKSSRDQSAVDRALAALTAATNDPSKNLLELAVNAARVRATIGEITTALETVWGRHQATHQMISGVYDHVYAGDPNYEALKRRIEAFAEREGRRPRILVVKMGQDGHDRGAKVVATAFADIGFDVDIGPLFSTPEEATKQAVENDVHVIGVSSLAAGHKTLIPKLIDLLKTEGAGDVIVIAGGVIPVQDHQFLLDAGVAAVFGPGTNIPLAAGKVLDAIESTRHVAT